MLSDLLVHFIMVLLSFLLQDFVASDPILSEFKAEIMKYQDLEQKIESIATTFRVGHGAIEIYSGKEKETYHKYSNHFDFEIHISHVVVERNISRVSTANVVNIFQHEKRYCVSPSDHVMFCLLYKYQL